jgi:hypothetical protein
MLGAKAWFITIQPKLGFGWGKIEVLGSQPTQNVIDF